MGDAALVRVCKGIGDLHAVAQHFAQGKRSTMQPAGERVPLQKLHHQIIVADVVERADVRMRKLGDCARLARQAQLASRIGSQRVGQYFHRDFPVQARVDRPPDLTHSARADPRGDLVRTEAVAANDVHGFAPLPSEAVLFPLRRTRKRSIVRPTMIWSSSRRMRGAEMRSPFTHVPCLLPMSSMETLSAETVIRA